MGIAQAAQPLQEARLGKDHAHVPRDGFHEDRGDPFPMLPEAGLDGVEIVVRGEEGIGHHGLGHAGRGGGAQGLGAGTGGHQEGIGVAVVAALEFQEFVPTGGRPGQPQGGHGGLGATVDQADHLQVWHGGEDGLRQLHLLQGRRPKGGAATEGLLDRRDDGRMAVAQDVGAVAADVIDVALTVQIDQVGTVGGADEDGVSPHALEGPHRGTDAPGDDFPGTFHGGLGGGGHGVESLRSWSSVMRAMWSKSLSALRREQS